MDFLHQSDFHSLAGHRDPWCVSIYMPTYRTGAALENPIRLKNLLRTAEEELVERGMRPPDARKHLKPGWHMLEEAPFWKSASDGLALFLGDQFLRAWRLPLGFAELAVVNKRFHIKPLLPLVSIDGRFLILAVSGNLVRLLEADRWRAMPVDLATLPKNLVDALNYDQPEIIRQCHSGGSGAGHQMSLAFHGQGGGVDAAKAELLAYFRCIDHALHSYLADERAPLVFAGVDFLFPIYQQASGYSHLLQQHISGNPDACSEAELHDRAWTIVEPVFRKPLEAALARYQQVAGSPLGSHELGLVLEACRQGAVETLLVDPSRRQWGTFNAETGSVHLDSNQGPGNEDLLDLAVALTLENRGKLLSASADYLPGDCGLAALFRYPFHDTRQVSTSGQAV